MWYRYILANKFPRGIPSTKYIFAGIGDKIQTIRGLNENVSPELEAAKQEYIDKATSLDPEKDAEELQNLWKEYTKKLRFFGSYSFEFPTYEEWRNSHTNEDIERLMLEHKPKALEEIQKSFEESDSENFEIYKQEKIETKARDIYNAEKESALLKQKLELQTEEINPLLAMNDVKKQWAKNVADHYAEMIPEKVDKGQQTVTLFVGYPGAGKSRFIEPQINDTSNPVRNTNYGILIDPDEYQQDLVGYYGGAGSQNTLVYAVSVIKPLVLKQALEKGNDVVIPMVGGSVESILNEAANHLVKGYNVNVTLVPTDLATAHQRSLSRAKGAGSRVIQPSTVDGNPIQAFEDAKNIIQSDNIDTIFAKKILTKLGYTPAKIKKMSIPEIKEIINQYKQHISFEVAQ